MEIYNCFEIPIEEYTSYVCHTPYYFGKTKFVIDKVSCDKENHKKIQTFIGAKHLLIKFNMILNEKNLPVSVESIKINKYTRTLNDLPNSLIEVFIKTGFNRSLNQVKEGLCILHTGNSFNRSINKFNIKSLRVLNLGDSFNTPTTNWSPLLEELHLGEQFN